MEPKHDESPVQEPLPEGPVLPLPAPPDPLPYPLRVSLIVAGSVVGLLLLLIVLSWLTNGRSAPPSVTAAPLVLDPNQAADPEPDRDPDPELYKDYLTLLGLFPNSPEEGTCFMDFTEHYPNRVKAWQDAAERDSPFGQYLIGRLCYRGSANETDPPRAFQNFLLAARQGLPPARFLVAECYLHGVGIPEDQRGEFSRREAATWYHRAALQGHFPSQCTLGICYLEGIGVEANASMAVRWFREAAQHGNGQAQYQLGLCYARGVGVEQNVNEAHKWLTEAAEKHDSEEARKALEKLDQMEIP
jgi:TPR repeat protein